MAFANIKISIFSRESKACKSQFFPSLKNVICSMNFMTNNLAIPKINLYAPFGTPYKAAPVKIKRCTTIFTANYMVIAQLISFDLPVNH